MKVSKYRVNSRSPEWLVRCDECSFAVKVIHGGPRDGTTYCNCKYWSKEEVKEARNELEG